MEEKTDLTDDEKQLIGDLDFQKTLFLNVLAMTRSLQSGNHQGFVYLSNLHRTLLAFYIENDNETKEKIKKLEEEFDKKIRRINNMIRNEIMRKGEQETDFSDRIEKINFEFANRMLEILMVLSGKYNLLLKESTTLGLK